MPTHAVRTAVGRGVATLASAAAIAVPAAAVTAHAAGAASQPPLSFTAISAGGGHTCVITSAGGVKCWGSNRFGQLGDGATRKCQPSGQCAPFSRIPVDVVGLGSGVKAIAAGGSHTCAITGQRAVKCWGYNASGQLGNGARIRCDDQDSCAKYWTSTPVSVVGLGDGVRAIATGDFQSCALTAAGGVKCWGEGMCDFRGSNTSACSTPADVAGLTSGINAIAAGAAALCGISTAGGVTCAPGLTSGVTAVSIGLTGGRSRGDAGSGYGCALTGKGGVKCWGANYRGQLGNGSTAKDGTPVRTPVDVVGLASGVRGIASGDDYSCAMTSGGGVKCWGNNYSGALGDGSRVNRNVPVDVTGLRSRVTAVDAGVYHACAVVDRREIKCWGSNVDGRLGNRSAPRLSPKPVDVLFAAPTATSPRVAPGGSAVAARRCSTAEATAVVKRLDLGGASLRSKPVWAVLCGSVAGPGSKTMVVSLATGGTSVPFGGWAVFRLTGGVWRLVFQQRNGAQISAAGSGIRERVYISRPGDPRCCPTGGSKARIWRWNGTRLVASAWTRATPGTRAPPRPGASTHGFFETPSGNILCSYAYDKAQANVGCVVKSGLRPQPPPRRPGCSPAITVALRATGRAFTTNGECPGEDAPETPYVGSGVATLLAYSTRWAGGGLRCTSAKTGLTCWNRDGHGFFLSRERWRAF